MRRQLTAGRTWLRRLSAAGASAALVGGLCAFGVTQLSASASSATATDHSSSCQLGNGIQHIVQIGFDNLHFFRDNPNVPSDLEQMPNLLNFIENNGTMLSNNHTPLVAHTANDLLTTATGLYGDRHGQGMGNNSYLTYNPDGTTDPATSFTYWTDPIDDTASTPAAGHDASPNMVYSPVPPATASSPVSPTTVAPAPWVPYTRAGCNVGEIATANQELENPSFDIPQFFGANSPEVAQLNADSDSFKDQETADYVGIGVHCAKGSSFCADAQAVKFGQTTPSPTAVADVLTDEPGGYSGFQALFGHKYVAPQLGAGTDNLTHDGFEVTNSAGNLVDLDGNQLNGAFLSNAPGFPGFSSINAAQSLAYAADMLENGVQVVNMYISDIHGNEHIPGLTAPGQACNGAPAALGSGTTCYVAQAAYYNAAFGTFLQRLAADGITPQNTLFVVSSDEGDHEAGANVGRAIQPSPANCDGVTTPCTYPAGTFGELGGNITGLLATQTGNTTPFSVEADTEPEFYVHGNPGPATQPVRQLEHDVASLTNSNPYSGVANEPITNYLANPVEEGILHMTNADPAMTPTLAMFAKPDYFLSGGATSCTGPCVSQNAGFAWDHGDYSADINTNYVGFVGPGVKTLGLDGPAADAVTSAGPNSGQTVVAQDNFPGPWVDETDIRPTIMYLTGLRDDYEHDGRVISQILTSPNHALRKPFATQLGDCYKQLNSSVGDFGAATLTASTNAIESASPGDATFISVDNQLRQLEVARDALAGKIKGELEAAAFDNRPIPGAPAQIHSCEGLIGSAQHLASSS
ncbi:MAG TPA: hypothetical protein VH520_12105 [Streptosporangiaceae bacterium]